MRRLMRSRPTTTTPGFPGALTRVG